MNTYEHCSYKHEPFPDYKPTPYHEWLKDLESGNVTFEELQNRFSSICRNCYPGIDLPVPQKSFRPQNWMLLRSYYALGKRIAPLKFLHTWYGQLQFTEQTSVVIKDVSIPNNLLPRLTQVLPPYLLTIVQNPFASIAAVLKGVELGIFGQAQSAKLTKIRKLIDAYDGKFCSEYRDKLEDISATQVEAVRWRMETEPVVEYAKAYENGLVILYENLCIDPYGKMSEIFDFVGWKLGQSTRDFIKSSISGERENANQHEAFYGVYRDPHVSLSKWKTQLTQAQIEEIAAVIFDSPLKTFWSNLPL